MQFFSTAVSQLGTIVIGLGAGLGVSSAVVGNGMLYSGKPQSRQITRASRSMGDDN